MEVMRWIKEYTGAFYALGFSQMHRDSLDEIALVRRTIISIQTKTPQQCWRWLKWRPGWASPGMIPSVCWDPWVKTSGSHWLQGFYKLYYIEWFGSNSCAFLTPKRWASCAKKAMSSTYIFLCCVGDVCPNIYDLDCRSTAGIGLICLCISFMGNTTATMKWCDIHHHRHLTLLVHCWADHRIPWYCPSHSPYSKGWLPCLCIEKKNENNHMNPKFTIQNTEIIQDQVEIKCSILLKVCDPCQQNLVLFISNWKPSVLWVDKIKKVSHVCRRRVT